MEGRTGSQPWAKNNRRRFQPPFCTDNTAADSVQSWFRGLPPYPGSVSWPRLYCMLAHAPDASAPHLHTIVKMSFTLVPLHLISNIVCRLNGAMATGDDSCTACVWEPTLP
jgi:hypothetical protein